jgi:hypothetical protein
LREGRGQKAEGRGQRAEGRDGHLRVRSHRHTQVGSMCPQCPAGAPTSAPRHSLSGLQCSCRGRRACSDAQPRPSESPRWRAPSSACIRREVPVQTWAG